MSPELEQQLRAAGHTQTSSAAAASVVVAQHQGALFAALAHPEPRVRLGALVVLRRHGSYRMPPEHFEAVRAAVASLLGTVTVQQQWQIVDLLSRWPVPVPQRQAALDGLLETSGERAVVVMAMGAVAPVPLEMVARWLPHATSHYHQAVRGLLRAQPPDPALDALLAERLPQTSPGSALAILRHAPLMERLTAAGLRAEPLEVRVGALARTTLDVAGASAVGLEAVESGVRDHQRVALGCLQRSAWPGSAWRGALSRALAVQHDSVWVEAFCAAGLHPEAHDLLVDLDRLRRLNRRRRRRALGTCARRLSETAYGAALLSRLAAGTWPWGQRKAAYHLARSVGAGAHPPGRALPRGAVRRAARPPGCVR